MEATMDFTDKYMLNAFSFEANFPFAKEQLMLCTVWDFLADCEVSPTININDDQDNVTNTPLMVLLLGCVDNMVVAAVFLRMHINYSATLSCTPNQT